MVVVDTVDIDFYREEKKTTTTKLMLLMMRSMTNANASSQVHLRMVAIMLHQMVTMKTKLLAGNCLVAVVVGTW